MKGETRRWTKQEKYKKKKKKKKKNEKKKINKRFIYLVSIGLIRISGSPDGMDPLPTAAHLFLPYLLAFISPEHSSIPSGGSYDSDGHFVLRWMKKQHPLHSPNWIRIFIIYVLNYLRTRQTQNKVICFFFNLMASLLVSTTIGEQQSARPLATLKDWLRTCRIECGRE